MKDLLQLLRTNSSKGKSIFPYAIIILIILIPIFLALRVDISYTDSYSKSIEREHFKVTINSVDKVSESISKILGGFRISHNIISSKSLDLDCKESTHLIMGELKKFCPKGSTLSIPLVATQITLLSKGDVVTYEVKDFSKDGS